MGGKLRRLFLIVFFTLVVIGFYSTDEIFLAQQGGTTSASGSDPCEECQRGVTELTLQYNGTVAAFIDVVQNEDNINVFSGKN